MKVKSIKRKDKEYPDNLRTIFGPPEELFVNGEILPEDKNAIAIVGTRRATYYGMKESEKLAYELALRGITIVSGMARGIDSAAHKGALKAGGRTIAVLGSGHGHIYPPENKELYKEITKAGAVVSELPQNTRPLKENFPRRNRIISGLSKGIVVIEAARRSGALITADFALEQGREVFAMPGNISSSVSEGTNALIKEGAKLIENTQDILAELQHVIELREIEDSLHDVKNRTFSISGNEKTVFGVLDNNPKPIDEILGITNLPTNKVADALLRLELKKLIKTLPGKNFVRT